MTAAKLSQEAKLLNQIGSSVRSGDKLEEVHLSIPSEVNTLEIGALSLTVVERGATSLVVDVLPYIEERGKQLYLINIKREWLSNIELSAVYNKNEKCGNQVVNSNGIKYNLTKAITRLSN
ncbi:hypothetical protein GCM10007877_21270 [Marinibactrum halimedae]|uniref:Uncharacterized protein n=1 Tax=Marinibactrum halimedae TaxID=1444977 RepID=A0AA37TC42_9GAMM|nr:hypothetical protein GCM10007877_21270 [Marinibactrum halimedae]